MPKQKRWAIKKKLDQAGQAVQRAQDYVVEVGYDFRDIHPDFYDGFSRIVVALEKLKASIQELSELI